MIAQELTSIAEMLGGGSTEAARRRAVSTAYYALFHAIATHSAAVLTSGLTRDDHELVYRSLDHAAAAKAFKKFATDQTAQPNIRELAAAFNELQQERHDADYRPEGNDFTIVRTQELIEKAKASIVRLNHSLTDRERGSLILNLLFKRRGNN